jgi:hypothetical protein
MVRGEEQRLAEDRIAALGRAAMTPGQPGGVE